MTLRSALVGLCVVAAPAAAAAQNAPLLVEADWLAQNIKDPRLVVLHVGTRQGYDASHVPGARYVTLDEIAAPHDHNDQTALALELPQPDVLRRKLESLGISDDSRIVVYFAADEVTPATRVIFTLDWIGLGGRTSLLNGGLGAWRRAGHALSTDAPAVNAGKLSARRTRDLVVSAEVVKTVPSRAGFSLVDARPAAAYTGASPAFGKSGHIPGARSIPFNTLLDDNLMLDRAHVERAFREAGVKSGDTVVGYCYIGQFATAMIFGARLIGHDVRLYDGSFQDWATNNRGAVEK